MAPSAAGAAWAARTGRPYVISPHGMLDPWITGRGRAKKWLARHGYERRSWARAALFHALTPAEADDIEDETGRDAIAVVPNAVDLHDRVPAAADPFLLYIGRIHPKKNLSALIAAWSRPDVRSTDPAARLVIAGWGEPDHVAQLEADIARSPDAGVSFIGPVYGVQKATLLGSARFVVLASLSEGLPVAVLEAWASGTPTLISPACHLPQGYAAGAAINSGTTPAAIAAACRTALSMNEAAWRAMSAAAHDLARAAFSIAHVGDRWSAVYGELLARR
jgi:poly(glycerol-phosphate) alpha-glucosyltransferase